MPTSIKSARAQPATKKTNDATIVDRVTELNNFFKDFAIDKSSATYKSEVNSASELHLLILLEATGQKQTDAQWKNAIKKNGTVEVTNKYNETALHWASVASDESISLKLLELGANVNAMSDFGSPLHYVIASRLPSIREASLLDAGANPSLRDNQKKTPLNYISRECKKYFQKQIEASKIIFMTRQFRAGRLPSLTVDQFKCGLEGAITLYDLSFGVEARDYLASTGVSLLFGNPYCSTCKMTFYDDKKYARHMLSIAHILKDSNTTEEAMLEARAYLEAKGTFRSVFRGTITIEDALRAFHEDLVVDSN